MISERVVDTKISSDTVIVAIDVGKVRNFAYYRRVNGKKKKLGTFGHTRREYSRIYEEVMRFSRAARCERVVICMESTSVC